MNNIPAISAVIMASGRSCRFGRDKLMTEIDGVPMLERLFGNLPADEFDRVIVVSGDERKLDMARRHGFSGVRNYDITNDTACTIRLGTAHAGGSDGCIFFVGDQPWLKTCTIQRMCAAFRYDPSHIYALSHNGKSRNPVIFPSMYYEELKSLQCGERGKAVLLRHNENVIMIEAYDEIELKDVDYPSDLKPQQQT